MRPSDALGPKVYAEPFRTLRMVTFGLVPFFPEGRFARNFS